MHTCVCRLSLVPLQSQQFHVLATLPLPRDRIPLVTHLLEWKAATQDVVPLDSHALAAVGILPPPSTSGSSTRVSLSAASRGHAAVRCSMALHAFLSSHGLHAEAAKVAWVLAIRLFSALRDACVGDELLPSVSIITGDAADTIRSSVAPHTPVAVLVQALAVAVGASFDSLLLVEHVGGKDPIIVVAHPPTRVEPEVAPASGPAFLGWVPVDLAALVPSVTTLPQIALAAAATSAMSTLVSQSSGATGTSPSLLYLLSQRVMLMPTDGVASGAASAFSAVPLLCELNLGTLCDALVDVGSHVQALALCHVAETAVGSGAGDSSLDQWVLGIFGRLGVVLGTLVDGEETRQDADRGLGVDALNCWGSAFVGSHQTAAQALSASLKDLLRADSEASPRRRLRASIAVADGVRASCKLKGESHFSHSLLPPCLYRSSRRHRILASRAGLLAASTHLQSLPPPLKGQSGLLRCNGALAMAMRLLSCSVCCGILEYMTPWLFVSTCSRLLRKKTSRPGAWLLTEGTPALCSRVRAPGFPAVQLTPPSLPRMLHLRPVCQRRGPILLATPVTRNMGTPWRC